MIPPSEYEKETREQVSNLDGKMDELKDDFHALEIKVIEAINHLSTRLPYWGVAIVALLCSVVGWLLNIAL